MKNCKHHGLDREDYLVGMLRRLPADATREQAAALTLAATAAWP